MYNYHEKYQEAELKEFRKSEVTSKTFDVSIECCGAEYMGEIAKLRSSCFDELNEREFYMSGLDGLLKGHTTIVALIDSSALRAISPPVTHSSPVTMPWESHPACSDSAQNSRNQADQDLQDLLALGWISPDEFEHRHASQNLRTAELPRRVVVGAIELSAQDLGEPENDIGKGVMYLSNVAVVESLRGRGIGRQLLSAAEKATGREGLQDLFLHVDESNTVAAGLYRSAGFREVPEVELLRPLASRFWLPQTSVLLHKRVGG